MRTGLGQHRPSKGTVGKLITDDALYNSAYALSPPPGRLTDIQAMLTKIDGLLSEARTTIDQVNAGKAPSAKLATTNPSTPKPPPP